jgi:mRNA interferase MazF
VEVGNQKGKAMADQLATVSKLRLISKMGSISPGELQAIERAIRVQLGML